MLDSVSFNTVTIAWTALAILLMPIQLFVAAPYGRHARKGWGPQIANRLGWVLMEVVSLLVFAALFLAGPVTKSTPMWVFFTLWVTHYIHRSLIFPFATRTAGKTMPVFIVGSAAAFNVMNGGLNGYYLGFLTKTYPDVWLSDPRFLTGLCVFIAGATINVWSDYRLIALRKNSSSTDYVIPRGGLFEWLSCPNLFGEIVQWSGFALMCWNFPALSFAVWTAANLLPRALSHHAWYRRNFAEYPVSRRAVVPFVL